MLTMRITPLLLALAGLLLAACALPTAEPAGAVAVTDAKDAEIVAERRNDVLILEIRSETGIGGATLRLPEGDLPRDLILRLHLRGLENLTFGWEAGAVQVSVSSTGEPLVRETFQPAGASAAEAIADGCDAWMNVGILSGDPDATPTIPLVDGHFDVSAPRAFLESGARDFTLSWIDFYR